MNDRLRNFLLATFFSGLAATPMVAHADNVVFNGDFENYSLNGWRISGKNNIEVVNSPIRKGNYAAKFHLEKPEYRAELVAKKPANLVMGRDYRIEFSIFIPSSWQTDHIGDILFQLHDSPDRHLNEPYRHPILALSVSGNNWSMVNRWDARPVSGKGNYGGSKSYGLGSLDKNSWTDWVIRIKTSYQSDGVLEVWKNGQKMVSQSGPNVFNDKKGAFIKTGIYKAPWKNGSANYRVKSQSDQREFYIDEFRVSEGKGGGQPDESSDTSDSIDRVASSLSQTTKKKSSNKKASSKKSSSKKKASNKKSSSKKASSRKSSTKKKASNKKSSNKKTSSKKSSSKKSKRS